MGRHRGFGVLGLLFCASVFLFAATFIFAAGVRADTVKTPKLEPAPLPRYEARHATSSELRESLLGLLQFQGDSAALSPELEDAVLKLIGTYRLRAEGDASSITNESFLKIIVSEVLKKFPRPCSVEDFVERDKKRDQVRRGTQPAPGPELEAFTKRLDELERCSADVERQRADNTVNVSYPELLDRALTAYIQIKNDDHSEAANLVRGFGGQIGKCTAKRIVAVGAAVKRAKEDPNAPQIKCDLDERDLPPEPQTFIETAGNLAQILFSRFLGCNLHIPLPTACTLRKNVYRLGKTQLMELRNDPRVLGYENQIFNEEVRKSVLAELNVRLNKYNEDLLAKFGGKLTDLLTAKGPLIERSEGAGDKLTLKEFADGLYADILAATALHRSKDPLARGVSAALVYAAANRAVLLAGGNRAKVTRVEKKIGKEKIVEDAWVITNEFNPDDPGAIPQTQPEKFGGLGVFLAAGKPTFGPWDVAGVGYDPTVELHVFPSQFSLNKANEPRLEGQAQQNPRAVSENLRDLGVLLDAFSYFLKVTGPGGELAEHFVTQEQFATELGNHDKPGIFPREGRALIYGLAAAILQNMAAAKLSHLEEASNGLKYHETLSLDPTDPRFMEPATTLGVSRVLLAARNFKALIDPKRPDPDFPVALLKYLPKVSDALFVGHLQLALQNPCTDGGFGSRVEGPCVGNTSGGGRTLQDSVAALRAVTAIYNDIGQEVVLIKLKQAWQFLDQFWKRSQAGSVVPVEVTGQSPQPVQPSRMWQLLALWKETQQLVRTKLKESEVPWSVWQVRMEGLQRRLEAQLEGDVGPEPLVP